MRGRYSVKHLREIPGVPNPDPGDPDWKPLRHHFGLHAFGVNAFLQHEAAGRLVDDHRETQTGHEELYVVVSGRAEFVLEGEPYDCQAGTCIAVPDPEVRRSAIAVEPNTCVLAVGGGRGEAFVISRWEMKWTAGLPQA